MTGLEVDYGRDRKLERVCTDEAEMQKRRADIAQKLKLRIKALEATKTVADLETDDPLGYWHQLTGSYAGCWAGKLSGNFRLIIRPVGDGDPWDAAAVTVIEIVDYH